MSNKLAALPDINFFNYDEEYIKSWIISGYEAAAGYTLADGDPRRLFLLSLAALFIQQNAINDTAAKMNLLAYAFDDFLDHLGALVGCYRIQPAAATTVLEFTLSAPRATATTIPEGTRATASGDTRFATDVTLVIHAGELSGRVSATATETGAYANGHQPGELMTVVDPIAFVAKVANVSLSDGGADLEDDDGFRTRIQEAPEAWSCAGSYGAYRYHAMSASALIADVEPYTPAPGEVCLVVLLKDGGMPTPEIIRAVLDKTGPERVRPLTDFVTASAPETVEYDIDLVYRIDEEDSTNALAIQKAVNGAVEKFMSDTRSRLGRNIDDSTLNHLVRKAGAIHVDIISPRFVQLNRKQIGIPRNVRIVFGGLEDG